MIARKNNLPKKEQKKVKKWRERIRKKYRYLKTFLEKHNISSSVFCNMTAMSKPPSVAYIEWVEYLLKSEGI